MDEHLGPATLDYAPPEPPSSRLPLIAFVCGVTSGPVACGLLLLTLRFPSAFMLRTGVIIALLAIVAPLGGTMLVGASAYRRGPMSVRDRVFAAVGVLGPPAWVLIAAAVGIWAVYYG